MSKKKNIKIEKPIDEIVKKWKQGDTQRELAIEYGVSTNTINKRISEYYEKIVKSKPKRKQKPKPKPRIELPIDEIVEKWKQGTTQTELAKEYSVSTNTIGRRIAEYHKKIGKPNPKQKQKIDLPINEIVKKWKRGSTKTELAIEYGISYFTINSRISEYYEKIGKPKRRQKIELPINEIIEKWKQGATQRELAKEYGVSVNTIGRRISEYYENIGKSKPKRKTKIELPIDEIVEKWEKGVTQRELAKEYGVSVNTIGRRIAEYHKKIGKPRPRPKPKPRMELPIDEIVEKWKQGSTIKELAKEYGVSQTTINKRISEYYENIGKSKPKRKTKIELPIDEIVEKWEKGVTQRELTKEYGVSYRTIQSRISQYYDKNEDNEKIKKDEKKLKVMKSSSIIAEYLKKGLTIEQIESIALKQNIIIPQKVVEKAIQRNEQLEKNKVEESSER